MPKPTLSLEDEQEKARRYFIGQRFGNICSAMKRRADKLHKESAPSKRRQEDKAHETNARANESLNIHEQDMQLEDIKVFKDQKLIKCSSMHNQAERESLRFHIKQNLWVSRGGLNCFSRGGICNLS